MTPRRGDVYWAKLPLLAGESRKPVLVVSHDVINQHMHVVAARITSVERERALPSTVTVESEESGLPQLSFVLCHDLISLPRDRLDESPVGTLSTGVLIEVERALGYVFDLPGGRR